MYYHTNHSLFERPPPPPLHSSPSTSLPMPESEPPFGLLSLTHSPAKWWSRKSRLRQVPSHCLLPLSSLPPTSTLAFLGSSYARNIKGPMLFPSLLSPHPAPAPSLSRARAHSHAHREIRTFTSARKVCWNPISRNARAWLLRPALCVNACPPAISK